jgi:hypothetical protein
MPVAWANQMNKMAKNSPKQPAKSLPDPTKQPNPAKEAQKARIRSHFLAWRAAKAAGGLRAEVDQ